MGGGQVVKLAVGVSGQPAHVPRLAICLGFLFLNHDVCLLLEASKHNIYLSHGFPGPTAGMASNPRLQLLKGPSRHASRSASRSAYTSAAASPAPVTGPSYTTHTPVKDPTGKTVEYRVSHSASDLSSSSDHKIM